MSIRELLRRRRLVRGMGCHRETQPGGGLPSAGVLGLSAVSPTADVSIEPWAPDPFDQGPTNSCIAQAIVSAEVTALRAQGNPDARPGSRLWLYYLTRYQLSPEVAKYDLGGRASDALRVLAERGLPPEESCPWDPARVNAKPSLSSHWDARDRRGARGTYAVYSTTFDERIRVVRAALAARKGVVLDIPVHDRDFADNGSPMLTYPAKDIVGWHLVSILSCNQFGSCRKQGSWGARWRDNGRAWLDPTYLDRARFVAVIDPQESPR